MGTCKNGGLWTFRGSDVHGRSEGGDGAGAEGLAGFAGVEFEDVGWEAGAAGVGTGCFRMFCEGCGEKPGDGHADVVGFGAQYKTGRNIRSGSGPGLPCRARHPESSDALPDTGHLSGNAYRQAAQESPLSFPGSVSGEFEEGFGQVAVAVRILVQIVLVHILCRIEILKRPDLNRQGAAIFR